MQTGDWDDSAWAPPSADRSGGAALLHGYRDFVQIARGGDSIVYRAHQDALDRDVAVKIVELGDDESIARFRRELAITVQLGRQHPNIMTVLATGTTTSGQPCLVMDYFELGSLQDRLGSHGPRPVSEVVAAGTVVADALAFAHTQGVLHRDVKPQNVLVLPTSWVLADFGLARAIDAGHSSSLERFSYRHASPQILDGEAPTTADDIYSLGSTLFTLLDGRAPFAAQDPDEDSALSYLRRARTERPRALTRDDIPPALREIVGRCLSRDPRGRYADAGALRDALESVPTESRFWAPDRSGSAGTEGPDPDPLAGFAPPVATPPEPAPVTPDPAPLTPEPAASPPPEPVFEPPAADEPARSALAQLRTGAPHERDPESTALRPVESGDDGPSAGSQHRAETSGSGSGRTRWLVIAAAALVALGAGIGIGVWRGSGGSPHAGHASSPAPSPVPRTSRLSSSTPSPTPTTTPTAGSVGTVIHRADPRITSFKRTGASTVNLSWKDVSHGSATFVVIVSTDEPNPRTVTVPMPGQTSILVPDLPAGRICLAVGMGIRLPGGSTGIQEGPQLCKTV